jgi:hypothetical protein
MRQDKKKTQSKKEMKEGENKKDSAGISLQGTDLFGLTRSLEIELLEREEEKPRRGESEKGKWNTKQ